jgi:hypothetical protein
MSLPDKAPIPRRAPTDQMRHVERAKAAGIRPSDQVEDMRSVSKTYRRDPMQINVVPGEWGTQDNLRKKK